MHTHTHIHTRTHTQHQSQIGLVILQTHSVLFCDLHVWVFQVPSTGNAQCGSADILMQLQGTKITVNFLLQLSLLQVPISPGVSVSVRAESRKLVFHLTRPQRFHLFHCHFPIGLSTVLSTIGGIY